MIDEKLQFEISQYVDGALAPEAAATLELRLQSDPEARKLLAEYRRINVLVEAALPVPEMDWDAMSRKISAAVDQHQATASLVAAEQTRSYTWLWRPVAMAAGVLLCIGVGLLTWRGMKSVPESSVAISTPAAKAAAFVEVFGTDAPVSPGSVEVAVGQAHPEVAAVNPWQGADLYPELTTVKAPRVLISAIPVRDEEMSLLH